MSARESLVGALREHALVIGDVTLSSGATASYYVDAKRAILRPDGFAALGELMAEQAAQLGATAVGGLTMGADPVACAALAGGAGRAFSVTLTATGRPFESTSGTVTEMPEHEPGVVAVVPVTVFPYAVKL